MDQEVPSSILGASTNKSTTYGASLPRNPPQITPNTVSFGNQLATKASARLGTPTLRRTHKRRRAPEPLLEEASFGLAVAIHHREVVLPVTLQTNTRRIHHV